MKTAIILLFVLVFCACSAEEKPKIKQEPKEDNISFEANDEKSEVNDTNVPLPVPNSSLQLQLAPHATLYALNVGGQAQGGGEQDGRELSIFLGFAPL